MNITRQWLESKDACSEGKEFFLSEKICDLIYGVRNLLTKGHFTWASWLLTRVFSHKQNVLFAIYCAERVLKIFEIRYPTDIRPRKAIQAAKKWIKNPTKENKDAANAADAADAAAYAAYAAANAADAAAYAAASAADAAAYAATYDAADAAAYAADAAANAAAYAADAADAVANVAKLRTQKLIINFGIKLYLKGDK